MEYSALSGIRRTTDLAPQNREYLHLSANVSRVAVYLCLIRASRKRNRCAQPDEQWDEVGRLGYREFLM